MSIRCSGFASRSLIIGSRLWPPAMMRASSPSRSSEAIALSTLVARSYSNGAGVCTPTRSSAHGQPLAGLADVFALLVLDRRLAADHRRAREVLRPLLTALRVELARGEAAALDVAQNRAGRVARGDRRLASEPSERERALRVDLADA